MTTRYDTHSRYVEVGAWSHRPYQERLVRYRLMRAMQLGLEPYDRRFSLREIAREMERLGYGRVSRERVRQVLAAPPQPTKGDVVGVDHENGAPHAG
jgi:hypothetical protein